MTIKQIHELLAKKLQDDLNTYSKFTKFSIKSSYNVQEPSEKLSTIHATMIFGNNKVAPIKNVEAYTLPAVVSFYCGKDYANEVMSILARYIQDIKGVIQTVGDYLSLPTYSTPSQSDITLLGEVGESVKVTMYVDYTVFDKLLFTNDITITLDGNQLVFNELSLTKVKGAPSDNVNNNQTLQSVPESQSLSFNFNCFLTPSAGAIFDEIMTLGDLDNQHTLVLDIKGKKYEYTVILSNGTIMGNVGGALYSTLMFSLADGKNGGAV